MGYCTKSQSHIRKVDKMSLIQAKIGLNTQKNLLVTGKMSRNSRRSKSRQKLRTAKVLDRITYSPSKHKQKNIRKMRQQLMLRPCISSIDESPTTPSIKFGSFNVNGMDTGHLFPFKIHWIREDLM